MHTFFWKLQFLARSIFQFVNDDICVCFCVTKLRNDFCWSPEYVMSVIRMWNVRIINVPSQPLQPFNLESSEFFFFGFVCPQCRSANLLESSLIPKQQLPLIVDPGVLRHVTHPKNSTLSPMDVVVVGLINLTWRHKQTWKEVIRTLQVVTYARLGYIAGWFLTESPRKNKTYSKRRRLQDLGLGLITARWF